MALIRGLFASKRVVAANRVLPSFPSFPRPVIARRIIRVDPKSLLNPQSLTDDKWCEVPKLRSAGVTCMFGRNAFIALFASASFFLAAAATAQDDTPAPTTIQPRRMPTLSERLQQLRQDILGETTFPPPPQRRVISDRPTGTIRRQNRQQASGAAQRRKLRPQRPRRKNGAQPQRSAPDSGPTLAAPTPLKLQAALLRSRAAERRWMISTTN